VSSGITAGSSYYFKVRAKNIYGYGDFSTVTLIKASGTPSQMAIPSTTNIGTDVKIQWVAPNFNSGTLIAYRILIRNSANTYVEDTTVCDGGDASVQSQQYCLASLTNLRDATKYNLAFGELVQARV
jgi:hypothetical protein